MCNMCKYMYIAWGIPLTWPNDTADATGCDEYNEWGFCTLGTEYYNIVSAYQVKWKSVRSLASRHVTSFNSLIGWKLWSVDTSQHCTSVHMCSLFLYLGEVAYFPWPVTCMYMYVVYIVPLYWLVYEVMVYCGCITHVHVHVVCVRKWIIALCFLPQMPR